MRMTQARVSNQLGRLRVRLIDREKKEYMGFLTLEVVNSKHVIAQNSVAIKEWVVEFYQALKRS